MRKKVLTSSFVSGALKSKLGDKVIDHFHANVTGGKKVLQQMGISLKTIFPMKNA